MPMEIRASSSIITTAKWDREHLKEQHHKLRIRPNLCRFSLAQRYRNQEVRKRKLRKEKEGEHLR